MVLYRRDEVDDPAPLDCQVVVDPIHILQNQRAILTRKGLVERHIEVHAILVDVLIHDAQTRVNLKQSILKL